MRMGAQAKNGAAKSGTRRPASSQEQREGTHLGLFSVLLAGLLQARGRPGRCWGGPPVHAGGPSSQNMDSIPHLNCGMHLGHVGGSWGQNVTAGYPLAQIRSLLNKTGVMTWIRPHLLF